MTPMKADGLLLTADIDDRVLTYRLLPYGEEGHTSLGKVTVEAGAVEIPGDVSTVILNVEHDRKRPVGRATRIEETDAGLEASFRIAKTNAGDELLLEASEGLRAAVSVEIESPVIKAGRLIKGLLTGAGAVVRPAFANALLVASDTGDDESTTEDPTPTGADTQEETTNMTELVPQDLHAGSDTPATPTLTAERIALVAASGNLREAETLDAAFGNIQPYASVEGDIEQASWLGEVWRKRSYARKYIPLISTKPLTGLRAEGWRFKTTPTVADWAGEGADVHSSVATVEDVSTTAAYIAGGFSVPREYVDLGSASFIQRLTEAAVDDYARKTDLKALAAILAVAASNDVESEATAEYPLALSRVLDGALHLISNDRMPSWALVPAAMYRDVLLVKELGGFKYLATAAGLERGSLEGFTMLPAPVQNVVVGTKEAVTYFEKGSVPVKVSAVDITKGLFDNAVHGYWATITNDPDGIVTVVAEGEGSGEGEGEGE